MYVQISKDETYFVSMYLIGLTLGKPTGETYPWNKWILYKTKHCPCNLSIETNTITSDNADLSSEFTLIKLTCEDDAPIQKWTS